MTDLLTRDQYYSLADSISYPTDAFINGQFQPALSGDRFTSVNPATGKKIADIAACAIGDVDLAVKAAREVFSAGTWSKLTPVKRKAIILRLADLIEANVQELAVLESLDSGKPIRECIGVDVPDTISTLRWHGELIDKIYDSTAPVGEEKIAMVIREPIGVVGLVLPWNFPLLMLAWKIGPALAAGCSLVIKPAKETTLTTLKLAELAKRAGIPDGVINIVPGGGRSVGEPIGRHMDIDMISFTGSTETGRLFLHYAADSNLKRIVLECGGKNPAVVMDDIRDIDAVAEQIVSGAFWNMGENCSATSRLIVHETIKSELLQRIYTI